MRWKLVLVTSLLATIIGAGASIGTAYGLLHDTPGRLTTAPDLTLLSTLLMPLAAIILASIFIYRHTSRRRALQAMSTALFAGLLTLAALIAGAIILAKTSAPKPEAPPPPPPRNVG